MAHFVKLIGSLERHGSELVPLNFSSDYTKETYRVISRRDYEHAAPSYVKIS